MFMITYMVNVLTYNIIDMLYLQTRVNSLNVRSHLNQGETNVTGSETSVRDLAKN